MTEIQGDLAATVVYDANGAIRKLKDPVTSNDLMSVIWTPFHKPASITRNGVTSTFAYAPDRSRYRHAYVEAGQSITRRYVEGVYEEVTRPGVTEHHHHIVAHGEVVATRIRRSNGVHATHWLLRDHLGSIDGVLDEAQQALRTSFDAFGQRRDPYDRDGPPPPGTIEGGVRELTARGYTDHEMLDAVALIHMNGRVYEPLLGRFLSPDPVVAEPWSTQGWSRYAYVTNDPLRYTDPTGLQAADGPPTQCRNFCGWGLLWIDRWSSAQGRSHNEPGDQRTGQAGGAVAGTPALVGSDSLGSRQYFTDGLRSASSQGAQAAPPGPSLQPSKPAPTDIPRRPDFFSINVNVAIPTPWTGTLVGVTVAVTVDENGDVYVGTGPSIGKTLTFVSGSVAFGWLNQKAALTEGRLRSFLTGHGVNASAGFWGGGAINYSPGTDTTATSFGFFTPQIGGGYTYSWHVGDLWN